MADTSKTKADFEKIIADAQAGIARLEKPQPNEWRFVGRAKPMTLELETGKCQ